MSISRKIQELDETLPWVEKYRPYSLDDVISHFDIINTLKKFITNKSFPHLLLYGPPGTGKTSVIMACARELYKEKTSLMVMEINASEDRGIEVVRNKITQFVSSKSMFYKDDDNFFKLVILDEADAMTADAQASLRKVIENNTKNARFCLICNFYQKINIALKSRCISFRFSPLKPRDIKEKLDSIIKKEKINITNEAIKTIIKVSSGDMRKVLNILQASHMAYDTITDNDVINIIGHITKTDLEVIIENLFNPVKTFKSAFDTINKIKVDNGYSVNDILYELSDYILDSILNNSHEEISSDKFCKILKHIRLIEYNLTSCSNDSIQLSSLIGVFKLSLFDS